MATATARGITLGKIHLPSKSDHQVILHFLSFFVGGIPKTRIFPVFFYWVFGDNPQYIQNIFIMNHLPL